MCGICGKLNFDRHEPVEPELIQRMTDLIHHRGPDGEGKYISGPVALGHRRLSIIDLNTGNQPMCNEDGTIWVVYNGEIYNFKELRSDLIVRGHKFKSSSDTEVIIHLYEEIGSDAVSHLQGMFAFALWDERKQILLLARDRVGIKPLYYMNTGKALLFGSEIKSILADPSVERRINPRAIDRFLTYYYLPGKETLLEGVLKLEPGYFLIVVDGAMKKEQYWDLTFPVRPQKIGFEDAVWELRSLLKQTVKSHMISDVPVGVLLSGGMDSTGILSYAAEQTDKKIHTFTIGFEGQSFDDERPYACLASQKYCTIHKEITISSNDFFSFLPKYVWHMEEPVCEPPAVALYYVAELARKSGLKVLLSGEGGDEAFGGYQNYRNLVFLETLKKSFRHFQGILHKSFTTLGTIGWGKVKPYAHLVDKTLNNYYLSRTATPFTFFNQKKKILYSNEFGKKIDAEISFLPTQMLFENTKGYSLLNQMLYVDTKTWLPDDLLVKADKITMATSLELRVPLLDFKVLEFAASLPSKFKVRGLSLKRILKAALKGKVPRQILRRKKTGFPLPYETWLREEMKGFVSDTLLGKNTLINAYLNKNTVQKLLMEHQQKGKHSKEIFCLIVLEMLLQQLTAPQNSFRKT